MRRLIATSVLLIGVGLASVACTSSGPKSSGTGASAATQVGGGTDTSAVCDNLRTVVATDMTPVGTALGTLVGNKTAGNAHGTAKARVTAATALKKLGGDIKTTAASGSDQGIRTAAATAAQNLVSLADDPAFLPHIATMPDIASATVTLQTATAPVATACQES